MAAHVVQDAPLTEPMETRRAGSASLLSTLARVVIAYALGAAAVPAPWARPATSLVVAALLVLVATAATVVPDVRAATVHDRQLDHILAVAAMGVAVWAALTWRSPSAGVVVAMMAGVAACLLLVGTRVTARMWPVGLGWLTAALPQSWLWLVVVLALVVALAIRVVRRRPTYALDNRGLGLPRAPRAVVEAVLAAAVIAVVAYGVIG